MWDLGFKTEILDLGGQVLLKSMQKGHTAPIDELKPHRSLKNMIFTLAGVAAAGKKVIAIGNVPVLHEFIV